MPIDSERMGKIEKEVMLVPICIGYTKEKSPYYEQILVYDGDYPIFMIHIDTLYERNKYDSGIYHELSCGNKVNCKLSFEVI
jgi:hypothetical protein